MTAKILNKFKLKMMETLIADIGSSANNYFVFVSRHNEWDAPATPDTETEDYKSSELDIHDRMLLGKKTTASDVSYMINKETWESNTVYEYYNHEEPNLAANNFYVINSSNNIYKCLFNNNDTESTFEPTSTANTPFTLSDNYIWKFMYSLSNANASKFATTDYIPVDPSSNVVTEAANGAIDVIIIEDGGSNWVATHEGFIQENVSGTVHKIEASAVSTNNYYSNSAVYIANGTAAGNLSIITNYFSNSLGNYITTADSISTDATSGYNISPQILITGNGTGAKAYSTTNANNVIDTITMITPGDDYAKATVTAHANSSYGTGSILKAMIPPAGGHGANAVAEFFSDKIEISVTLANNEGGTVPDEPTFRQAGIIINPSEYANGAAEFAGNTFNQTLSFDVAGAAGAYTNNEIVTGLSSNAMSYVVYSNSTFVMSTEINGVAYANGETVLGSDSGISGTISNINTPEIQRYSGDIYYFDNVVAIQRSNTASEEVRLIIQF
jgi:hypothetical protein